MRLTTIRRLNSFWNNIWISTDCVENYKIKSIEYEKCKKKYIYHFVGYKLSYDILCKISRNINKKRVYDDIIVNRYMMKHHKVSIVSYMDPYCELYDTDKFAIGIILKPSSLCVNIFKKCFKKHEIYPQKLKDLIISNKIVKYFDVNNFQLHKRKHKNKLNEDINDKIILYYMKDVLYRKNINIDIFCTLNNITVDDLVSIICPPINIAMQKILYEIKHYSDKKIFFKKKVAKLHYRVEPVNHSILI
jgi:hypothetical protein